MAVLATMALPMAAQETYENTNMVDNDLNGTARYVGMGGAMDALGADISTISTNPAGIGLFRSGYVGGSFGFVSQDGVKDFANGNKTTMSFDQIGLVYAMRNGRNSFLNVAFNYHKSRNFNQILSAADRLDNASQNKLTYQKLANGVFKTSDDATYNQLDHLYLNNLLYNKEDDKYYNYPATGYTFNRATKGYIGEYDLNISGNIHDRVYLGVTVGLHDVHYKHYSEYAENFASNPDGITGLTVGDSREITGSGVDIKAGVIFRPVESSPFRIGISVASPTFYDLTTRNYTTMTDGAVTKSVNEGYDFKLYTPWKFGLSLGHTVGNYLALGASYEYADYGSMDTRINEDGYYDGWYGTYYESSSSDANMNKHTEQTLKGVSTLKLGLEYKPVPEVALRVGYNYVSPMYNENGFKDGSVWSAGSYYASQTDYTNWKSTNRFTLGAGYNVGRLSFDVAYQYSAKNGDFYPFMSYVDSQDTAENNIADAVKVNDKHHQVLFTIGYKF